MEKPSREDFAAAERVHAHLKRARPIFDCGQLYQTYFVYMKQEYDKHYASTDLKNK